MNEQTPVYRIVVAHPGHSHDDAIHVLARIVRNSPLPGATFTPSYGLSDRWESITEPSTTVEIATDVGDWIVRSVVTTMLATFRQEAAYVTVDGARPVFWESTPPFTPAGDKT